MEKIDITIIGAGVVGLSIAHNLSKTDKSILVIEKHQSFGQETSSRNSEVIHAGIYYPPCSLKIETCIQGRQLLYELCKKHSIPHKKSGKLIVAQENSEFDKLEKIRLNAIACGIKNVRYIEKNELKSMEPAIRSERTLLIPDTGIVDTHLLMKFLHDYARSKDIDFVFGTDVTDIKRSDGEYLITVKEPNGESFSFCSTWVINAAGLYSDAIAKMPGLDVEEYGYKLHFSKGQYFRIQKPGKFNITRLVYPPPSDIDLGIHLTPDLAGGLRLGPDSEYVGNIEYSVDPNRTETFFSSARRFLPSLDISDITPESSGIRPKLQTETGPFRDFVISEESEKGFPHMINLIGIESPGLTASLAIAKKIERLIK